VPDLEIENNDVRCSHASTVGPIDLDQRFYLESRGVPPEVAERLILSGFFEEVIARLPVPALGAGLRRRIAAKLDHASSTMERRAVTAS
jgi:Fe-S cluster assembly protein SufD